jgi:hypothetical protein
VFCEIVPDVPDVVKYYRDNRTEVKGFVREMMERKQGSTVTRDEIKQLFISLCFGGSVYAWRKEHSFREQIRSGEPGEDLAELDGEWGTFLGRMEDALVIIRRKLVVKYPEEFAQLSWKSNAKASLSFHAYAHYEAEALQRRVRPVRLLARARWHRGEGRSRRAPGSMREGSPPSLGRHQAVPSGSARVLPQALPRIRLGRQGSHGPSDVRCSGQEVQLFHRIRKTRARQQS